MYNYIYWYTSSMDIREQQRIIINFISNNQFCNSEDIVKGVKNHISRVLVFRNLRGLVADGAVRDNRINRRDHRYSVDENNLLVQIPKQLDDFKQAYFLLIDKYRERFSVPGNKNKVSIFQKYGEFTDILSIYESVIQLYLWCGIHVWPKKIRDNESLSKLYTLLFSKLSEIQLNLAEKSRAILKEYDMIEGMITSYSVPTVTKKSLLKSSKKAHSVKELNAVMGFIDSIKSSLDNEAFNTAGGKIRIGGRGNHAYASFKSVGGKTINSTVIGTD
jgi:hypothetical protein